MGIRGIFDSIDKNFVNTLTKFIFKNKLDINNFYSKGDWKIIYKYNVEKNEIKYNVLANEDNFFEVKYRAIGHDYINIKISNNVFRAIKDFYLINNKKEELRKSLLKLLMNNFQKINNTGTGGEILESDYNTGVSVMIKHLDEIIDFFQNLNNKKNLLITTNRVASWDKSDRMGVFEA